MTPDPQRDLPDPPGSSVATDAESQRKIAARRRFLRIGAQGSAALVVTVAHRRAFAGIKKNVVASACASLRGTPDLKNTHQKKGLEVSAMGTPKGIMCRPRPPVQDPNSVGNCVTTDQSKYYYDAGAGNYQKAWFVKEGELKKGCGTIEKNLYDPTRDPQGFRYTNTITASHNYRLYEKGYCPIVFDADGGLTYKADAKYYRKDGSNYVMTNCEMPPP